MSTDVYDLTDDKTMNANTNVKLANDDVWSAHSAGGTSALIADTGASETAYRRPHAPRSAKPKSAALTGLHFDISSTSRLRSATHRSRISDYGLPIPSLLHLIRAGHRPRIGHSPVDQVSQIRRPVWSRVRNSHPSHPLPESSADSYIRRQLAAYCRPNIHPTAAKHSRRFCANEVDPRSNPTSSSSSRLHNSPTCAYDDECFEAASRERKRLQRASSQPQ